MLRVVVFLLAWPGMVLAQEQLKVQGVVKGAGVTEALRRQILKSPEQFEDFVSGLIRARGGARGLDVGRLERVIASERTRLWVREMRRLMLADRDADGIVTGAELATLRVAANVTGRDDLWQSYMVADVDSDGVVTRSEMRRHARSVTVEGEARIDGLRELAQLDFDGNGFVSKGELAQAIAMIAPET